MTVPNKHPKIHSQRMVNKNQSLTISPACPEWIIKFRDRKINGNAIPSLHPDSADNKLRKWPGTLSANFPLPTTAAAKTGSVAVTHALTSNPSLNVKWGMRHQMKSPTINHPHVMTGNKKIVTESQCFIIYFFGNSTATATIWIHNTIRQISRVM